MLMEAARRAESAAREVLTLVGAGSASCAEIREVLPVLKSAAAAISAAQTDAAASVAARERHGDGGAEILADAAGLSRQQAKGQVKAAATLRKIPALREAVESGRVPQANARQLATAADKAGAGAVASDPALLEAAETMRPEHFAAEARRWSVDRQGDDGASEHARQRARRRLRVWDGDDGMMHLHADLDKVAGTRIANRLRRQARGLLDADKKTPGAGRRSFDQCMADALETLTSHGQAGGTRARPSVAGDDLAGSVPGGNTANPISARHSPAGGDPARLGPGGAADPTGAGRSATHNDPTEPGPNGSTPSGGTGTGPSASHSAPAGLGPGGAADPTGAGRSATHNDPTEPGPNGSTPSGGTGARPAADICVMVHADDETAKLVAELPDRTRLPQSVLDALSCDASIAAVICDRQGSPIWRSYASRGATETQKQILFAKYGGCFHCGANPGLCQIHHIKPVWLGGKTEINNLVPLCYGCHSLIHEHRWWILKRTLGHHSMHPPDHVRHGPAHQPDHPILYRTASPANDRLASHSSPPTNSSPAPNSSSASHSQPDPPSARPAPEPNHDDIDATIGSGGSSPPGNPPPRPNHHPRSPATDGRPPPENSLLFDGGAPSDGNRQREPALF